MAHTTQIKRINRNEIYRFIYGENGVSQQEIALRLSLSMPTVNQNLSVLRQLGLIEESGTFESTGGRKAKIIRCVPDARIALGLDITANHISLVAINMKADVLQYSRIRHRFVDSLFYYNTLGKFIDSFIDRNHLDREKILGLGICLPAIIAEDRKTVTYSKAVPVPPDLYQKLKPHVPVSFFLFNDANSGGFAESWNMEREDSLVYLSLSNSVGGAIVQNNKLYTGSHQKSCEFGHVTLIPNGKPCYCGQKGCLNAYCSASLLSDMTEGKMQRFFSYVKEGQEPYASAFRQYLEYLAIAVNNLRMHYDCDIVLGGYVGSYMGDFLEEFREMVRKRNPFEEKEPYIFCCRYKFETAAIGAALYYIDEFIKSI